MSYGMTPNATGIKQKAPSGYQTGQLQNYTPQQMKLHQSMFGDVGPDSYLRKLAGGDEELFSQIEALAFQQFQGLQGQLASRFSGQGLGGRKGSGFQNAANQQTSDFAMNLQSQRMGLQRQAQQDLWSMSQQLLGNQPYQNYLIPKQEKKEPFWKQALGAISPLAGDIASGDTHNTQNFFQTAAGFI